MDLLAKSIALQAIISGNLQPPTFISSLGFGTVLCHSSPISNSLQQNLYYTISHNKYITYVSSLFDITPSQFEHLVDWDCFRLSRSKSRFGLLKFISKFIAEDIATGKVMQRRKQRVFSNCPGCNAPNEDILFVLICPSDSTFRSTLIIQLQSWLYSSQTDPQLTSFIFPTSNTGFLPHLPLYGILHLTCPPTPHLSLNPP